MFVKAQSVTEEEKTRSTNPKDPAQSYGAYREDNDILKAYIPEYLYKPPYGFPRKVNINELKMLAKNPYVFSVIKTFADEASAVAWKIVVKEEWQKSDEAKDAPSKDYTDKIKQVTNFFQNPNGNDDSFDRIIRALVAGIIELDAGVIVKVFNAEGNFTQMFVRDGGTFLMNPDIYGYIGNRADYIFPATISEIERLSAINTNPSYGSEDPANTGQLKNYYDMVVSRQAAYWQYGWATPGGMPVPYGKREIVYIMQNPRYDSIYGRSPLEVLRDVVLTLVYGSQYNLSFYTNNNMPDGAIELLGANKDQIDNFRANFEAQFKTTDEFGNERRIGHKAPISSTEVKYVPFQLTAKDMEIIAQQEWFTKVLWMCFGVTADEMGFTENSNRATSEQQSKLVKRKALKPLLRMIAYHINQQIMPEFFGTLNDEVSFDQIPLEFQWDDYDIEEDQAKHNLLEQELRMGVKTPEMAAAELNIDLNELEESIEKNRERQKTEMQENKNIMSDESDEANESDDEKEEKEDSENDTEMKGRSTPLDASGAQLENELDAYVDAIEKTLLREVDKIQDLS